MIRTNFKSARALAAVGVFSLAASHCARAVVLELKPQIGQSASYDMTMSGDISLSADAQTPVPWAGMPLSVPVSASGQLAFDTLNVDAKGAATVRTRVPNAQLQGSVFGINAVVTTKNGIATFSLNGAAPKTFPVPFLVDPTYAVNVSRLGRIQNIVPVGKSGVQTASLSSTRIAPKAVLTSSESASYMQKWLDSMPDVWPDRDLKIGDTWTIQSKIPLAKAPGGVLEIGTTNLKLIGQETVGGVVLQRIAIDGTTTIDAQKAALINAAMPQKDVSKGTAKLVSDSKKVSGDLWFDASAGRLARVSLKIAARNAMGGTTKPDATGKTRNWSSTQGFDGTFGMTLNSVSMPTTSAKTPIS